MFSGFISTLMVYGAVRILARDITHSVWPGWHTTIYPPEVTWIILTILIIVCSVLVYFVFRGATKILTSLWGMIVITRTK
jgi:hypothetical protein